METITFDTFYKDIEEDFPIAFDFNLNEKGKPPGTTLISGVAKAFKMLGNKEFEDVTSQVIDNPNVTISGNRASVRVKNGEANRKYKIEFLLTLSDNSHIKCVVYMQVLNF